jgi:hypothetical protein
MCSLKGLALRPGWDFDPTTLVLKGVLTEPEQIRW